MKSFFKNVLSTVVGMVLAVIVIMLLFVGIISLSISSINNKDEITVKENSILEINLSDLSVVERTSKNHFGELNLSGEVGKTIELKVVLDNIEKAKTDDNIKAIYINSSIVNAGRGLVVDTSSFGSFGMYFIYSFLSANCITRPNAIKS